VQLLHNAANLLVAAAHTRQVNRPLVFTIAHWFDCTLEHLPEAQRAQYAAAIASATAVTSLTREMQREVERRYDRGVVLIPPGHPVPERSPRKADPPLVLWLGRLNAVAFGSSLTGVTPVPASTIADAEAMVSKRTPEAS